MALDQQPQLLQRAFVEKNFHRRRTGSSGASALFAAKSNTH
jgi:hypothetical protein